MTLSKQGNFTFNHVDQQDDLYKVQSALEIKTDFDSRANELKATLNALIDSLKSQAVNDSGAENIAIEPITGVIGANVQNALEDLRLKINSAVAGTIPDGSIGKEKLNFTIASKDSDVDITDVNNHFTAIKLDGVLDELFTSANSVKTNVSGAIGSPATVNDTGATLAGYINTQKGRVSSTVGDGSSADTLTYLVDRLLQRRTDIATTVNGKGVPATSADTLAQLATKVGQIQTTISGEQILSAIMQETINKNDAVYLQTLQTKLANPASLPSQTVWGESFSPDGNYLAVAHDGTPFISIYKRSGDAFTKLANPDVLPPTSTPNGVTFSPDNTYLTVAHTVSPFITIYKRSGDVFTKLPNPSILPTGTGYGVSFSQDNVYMAVAHNTSPFLSIYKRSGDTFTKLANPTTIPTGLSPGVSFSQDTNYLAVGINGSPFIMFYKRNGDVFTKLADPTILPPATANGVSFSSDNNYVAIAHGVSPYLTIYKRNADTFTRLSDPSGLPLGLSRGVAFSPDANYLAVTNDVSPFVILYKRNGDVFTKVQNTSPLPAGLSTGVAFSLDGNYMAVGHNVTPFFSIYKKSTNVYKSLNLLSESVEGFGYAKEAGTSGESKQIGLIWR
jgi:WD40 repeat protein